MRNELKAGAALSYISIAVNNIVGLAYTPYLLRMLGQNEYGLYSLVASIVAYLTILDLGFANAIVRFTAKFRAEGNEEAQCTMFGMFMRLYILIGLFAFIIGLALLFNIDRIFDNTMTSGDLILMRKMMLLLVFNIAVTFPMSIWGAIMTAYEKFVFLKTVNILRIILNAVVMVILLHFGYKAFAMVVVLTVFNLLSLSANAWFCKAKLKIRIKYGKFNWVLLREIFSYSIWILVAGLVDRFYWSSGQFVLGIYFPPEAIAVFGVAIQLQAFYSSFSFAISNVFFPRIVRMVAQSSSAAEISDLFIRIGRLQFHIMALVFSGFIVFGAKFVALWAGTGYDDAYTMSIILFSAILLSSCQTLGNSIIQAKGSVKFRALAILIVSAISLLVSFPMARNFGGIGCCYCISAGIFVGHILILNWYYANKLEIDVCRFWLNILRISAVPALMTAIGLSASAYIQQSTMVGYLSLMVGYVVIYFSIDFMTSLNSYERGLFKPILSHIKIRS